VSEAQKRLKEVIRVKKKKCWISENHW